MCHVPGATIFVISARVYDYYDKWFIKSPPNQIGMVCEGYFISMLPAERKWRQQYGSHAFKHILEHIAVIYDVGCGANLNSSTANSTFASNRSNNVADSVRDDLFDINLDQAAVSGLSGFKWLRLKFIWKGD